MGTFIVLLGPPGVGKGTQAKTLAERKGLAHISSGDLFRENIKDRTALGLKAQSFINRGDLVPDDVTIAMVRERLKRADCQGGAILDGFPRTPAQADALSNMLAEFDGDVDAVPLISAAEDVLIDRLSGRWTCRAQGHIFHERFKPPRISGICDIDGSELYQREDDQTETVKRRIKVYFEQTAPLITYYREAGILIEINGAQSVENVTSDLLEALK
jgi:adenylate kinase